MILEKDITMHKVWQILEQVTDPEIPVLSILDLGIVRDVLMSSSLPITVGVEKELTVEIVITPTYSGCPAMDVIAMNIRIALLQNGFKNIKITQQLSPAWTTDWMTKEGKNKLNAYGIAPPQTRSDSTPAGRMSRMLFTEEVNIKCPQCHSKNTKLLSQFGSTACKALYQCNDCKEPFDYFKCH
ncbi:MAG: 1,2-phenylacetyl-CoA epoxidase subunit PaaD [Ginsengibacter sp.]